jgi:uncharacterized membrane protein YidH (DUF202 family)
MSLSVLGYGIGLSVIPLAIFAIVLLSYEYDRVTTAAKPNSPGKKFFLGLIIAVLVSTAVAGVVVGTWSYNNNIRQSHINCLEAGGLIYNSKCVDKLPVEIQRL